MNKENVVYVQNGVIFSHKKDGTLAIWDNTDEAWGDYTK